MICSNCNEDMLGDGHTSVIHCPNADESLYEFHEPDANPVYCEELVLPDGTTLSISNEIPTDEGEFSKLDYIEIGKQL